jgi:hypothetical protein
LFEHARRQRIGLAIVFDVDVQTVHDIEMGIFEQRLQGRIAKKGIHLR